MLAISCAIKIQLKLRFATFYEAIFANKYISCKYCELCNLLNTVQPKINQPKHVCCLKFATLGGIKKLMVTFGRRRELAQSYRGCFYHSVVCIFYFSFNKNQLTQSTNALESSEELLEFAQHALDIKDENEFTKVCIYIKPLTYNTVQLAIQR